MALPDGDATYVGISPRGVRTLTIDDVTDTDKAKHTPRPSSCSGWRRSPSDPGLRQQIEDSQSQTYNLMTGPKADAVGRTDDVSFEWRAVNAAVGCALRDIYPAVVTKQ